MTRDSLQIPISPTLFKNPDSSESGFFVFVKQDAMLEDSERQLAALQDRFTARAALLKWQGKDSEPQCRIGQTQ